MSRSHFPDLLYRLALSMRVLRMFSIFAVLLGAHVCPTILCTIFLDVSSWRLSSKCSLLRMIFENVLCIRWFYLCRFRILLSFVHVSLLAYFAPSASPAALPSKFMECSQKSLFCGAITQFSFVYTSIISITSALLSDGSPFSSGSAASKVKVWYVLGC